ncbi:MAG: hypothetical protein M0R06_21335, partial [Sphaerochaeta sp.]|nr:hypothetical protein [Sphaerochaeta sp.]
MLDSLQPFGLPALGRLGGRARPKVPDMTPEEERSLLSSTMGVLSWLGESLDKPRLAVHGLLAGKPMELLRAIPFSDTLGITDEDGILGDVALTTDKDRTSGRDLLEAWGVPRNKPGLSDWGWDLAGFATEFADPLVMVSGPGKAVTAAGKALQQGVKLAKGAEGVEQAIQHADDVVKGVAEAGKILGTSPAAKIEEIRKGQRALFNLHNPFTGRPFYEFGAGSERAAKAMETLYYGKYSPIVPLRSLLSPIVAGVDPKAGTDVLHNLAMAQKAKDRTFSDLKQLDGMLHDMGGVIDERMGPLGELWADIGKHAQESGDDVSFASADEFVRYLAGLKDFSGKELAIPKEQIAKMFEVGGLVDAPLGKINEFVEQSHQLINLMRQVKDKSAARYIELGGKMDWLDDAFSLHSPRRPDKGVFAAMFDKIQKSRMFSTGFEWSMARKDIFRHLPGSDVTVNRACRDELLTATDDLPDALGKAMRNPEGTDETLRVGDIVTAGDSPELDTLVGIRDIGQEKAEWVGDVFRTPQATTPGAWPVDEVTLDDIQPGIGSHKPAKNASQVVFDEPPVPVRAGQVAEASGEKGWVVSTTGTHATLYIPGDKPKIREIPLGEAKLATGAKVLDEVGASPWRNVERAPILTKDDLAEELRGRLSELAGKDIPPGGQNAAVIQELTKETIDAMSLPALQREYLWHKYLKPEVMKAAERGMNPEDVHLAVKRLREGLKNGDVFNGRVIDADEAAVLPELSEYLTKLPKDVRKTGLFNRTTFMDWMDYNEHLALSVSNLSTIHHFVRQAINTGDEKTRIPLKEAWQSVETTKGSRALTDDGLAKLARDYVADLNTTNPTEAARILSQYDMTDPEQLGKFVETLRVNPAVSEMIGRYMDINTASGKGWLTAVYDKALTAFKWSATMPWPSFQMRNYVDGQLRNFLRVGRDTYSLPQLMRAMKESTSFWKKKNPETLRYGRDFLAEHPLRMGEAVDIQGT